jgi:hypothetical protein
MNLLFKNLEKEKRAVELIIANKIFCFFKIKKRKTCRHWLRLTKELWKVSKSRKKEKRWIDYTKNLFFKLKKTCCWIIDLLPIKNLHFKIRKKKKNVLLNDYCQQRTCDFKIRKRKRAAEYLLLIENFFFSERLKKKRVII